MRQRINYVTPEVAVRAVQSGDWVDYGFGAGFLNCWTRLWPPARGDVKDVKRCAAAW